MYTIAERLDGYDSSNLYLDGKYIGFVGDDNVGLQRCPECGVENHAMAVLSGVCYACGWKVDIESVEKVREEK